ncbi:LLM class F420-dependent oxidoreductase [Mycolicibacter hiberniae]|uniref:LLM class F420-dependent oxidoreductase n=1 Tax=Mycolicibacter hiberniae TaxID=29314 RepID=A0A7I7WZ45_9MYCO|nr:LLM class F420-dependent oxidoreductase [Mycolicibacter hiberniae]MCV7086804.1 LLM class F420-dependent oxidoreductase [Mycolicibacter hiberniae]ORV70941.1 luciferase [Mycolicibacter hiberniae]BBZ21897.1 LLM class F420-dependent oxidoreductase [Mycolicibacter hiberniae]
MHRQFRFGVGLNRVRSAADLADTARRLEGYGFDVLHVPDHLGAPAPFPVLVAAAAATSTIRLGTYVLNACFYKPALLARDIADTDLLSDGRLEVGLGAGYVRAEFEAAELPFPAAGRRVDYLEHVTSYLATHQPGVPILIAGNGDRLLSVAARHAGIVGLTGARVRDAEDPLAERVGFVRAAAGDRFDTLEFNLAITAVPTGPSGIPDLSLTRRFAPASSDEQLLASPAVLSGSVRDMADALRELRSRYGISYFTVQQQHARAFAEVIAALR